jgi:beta-aspartyl-peptidase (threonine type)
VHGGAGTWPRQLRKAAADGVRGALQAGWQVLNDGVQRAVAVMEDDETFNAGRGSCLTSDGRVQMDALIMEGARLRAGAVACVERLPNPVRAARLVLEHGTHVLLAGPDAERFVEQLGADTCDPARLIVPRQLRRLQQALRPGAQPDTSPSDTVGAVALDGFGNLAAATSTGGLTGKTPGRVGDSPLIGCGGYADNEAGAASTTGRGEGIMKVVLARWAVARLHDGSSPQEAARAAMDYLWWRVGGTGGIILLDERGEPAAACTTNGMPWGFKTRERELVQELKGELA